MFHGIGTESHGLPQRPRSPTAADGARRPHVQCRITRARSRSTPSLRPLRPLREEPLGLTQRAPRSQRKKRDHRFSTSAEPIAKVKRQGRTGSETLTRPLGHFGDAGQREWEYGRPTQSSLLSLASLLDLFRHSNTRFHALIRLDSHGRERRGTRLSQPHPKSPWRFASP